MLSKRRRHSFETRLSLADRPGTQPTRDPADQGLEPGRVEEKIEEEKTGVT
jgi:hypothetical protein